MTEVDLAEIDHGVVVRPGDTLVIAVSRITTPEQVERLKEGVAEHLPGVQAVVVEANQLAVYRPKNAGA